MIFSNDLKVSQVNTKGDWKKKIKSH